MEGDKISTPTTESLVPKTTTQRLEEYVYTLIGEVQHPLIKLQGELYQKFENMHGQKFGVPKYLIEEAEENYWRVAEKVQDLEERINGMVDAIDRFENGEIPEEDLEEFLPQEEAEPEKISKRKQAIAREEERLKKLGIDPREVEFDIHVMGFGADPYRFSTGKHQKRVGGNMDLGGATVAFFDSTVDTHGGKVSYGKRGNFYKSKSGKRIRKV